MKISKKNIAEMRKHFEQEVSHTNGKLRAYMRISSTMEGQDEARQKNLYEKFVNKYTHFEDRNVYMEIATSKGGFVRKKFNDMISDAKANKFDVLFVDQVSRLGRNVREGLNAVYDIMDEGIRVYIEQWGKIFNPFNMNDRMMLTFQFLQAEVSNDMNSRQTCLSMDAKRERLAKWGIDNGYLNVRINNHTIFDIVIEDPFHCKEKSPSKLGISVMEIPHMKEMFIQYVLMKYTWTGLSELFKKPVNIKCKYGCYNGKKLPFGGYPREKGNREEGTKRTTRKEVATFINDGSWTSYIKMDKDIDQKAFETNGIKNRKKRKCGCGQSQSETTIANYKSQLVYKEKIMDKMNPDAFKRADCDSHEVSMEEMMDMIGTGKVSSS